MFLVQPRLPSVRLTTFVLVFISALIVDFDWFTRRRFVRLRRLFLPFIAKPVVDLGGFIRLPSVRP